MTDVRDPPRPLNVLDIRDTHEIGGPGKTILETFRAVDARRFKLHLGMFLTRHEGTDTPFVHAARALGMPVHFIRGYNQFDPRLIWRTARLVESLGIDIVHAHEVKSDVIAYLASLIRTVPIVTTLHGWIANTPRQRAFVALDRWVMRRFDVVFAVSGQIRDEIVGAGVSPSRARLMHNAIVLDRYRRTGRNGFLHQLLGRPVEGPTLVSIGRLSFEKGHADLVDAIGTVVQRGHRLSAVFLGDGPERGPLTERIDALGLGGAIHLPGFVHEPQRALEEADLMVLPSHTEGLPNAALEALAMEVPVLATRVGGTPEVITHGDTGHLVPPRSPDALAGAIEHFLAHRDEWARSARRGRAHVEQHFDFRARTRHLEAVYLELAGARP